VIDNIIVFKQILNIMSCMERPAMEVHPTYAEATAFVYDIAQRSPFVKPFVAGKSFEGRDIVFAVVTDPAVPDADKQITFITGGTHGSEETGRDSSMAFLEWLACDAAAEATRRNQIVYITTCLNPDGSLRNSYHNAQDVNIYASFKSGATASAAHEGNILRDLILKHKPDICIDVHGLAGGGMNDTTYLHACFASNLTSHYSEIMTRAAFAAAEAAGIPQSESKHHGTFRGTESIPYMAWAHEHHNSLCFTVETTENYYPLALTRRSGLAKIQALTAWGNRVNPPLPWKGYPVDIISGSSMFAIMPLGTTAAQRRASRAEIFGAIHGMPGFQRSHNDGDGRHCKLTLSVAQTFDVVPRGFGAMARFIRDSKIEEIRIMGKPVDPAACLTWSDACSLYLKADVITPLEKGEYVVEIVYTPPFKTVG
jgi:hypothetical protein